ncbi:hypothetical protein [Streptomyces marincola]|nr:hypothetical protein [Streptomyces marincola]
MTEEEAQEKPTTEVRRNPVLEELARELAQLNREIDEHLNRESE